MPAKRRQRWYITVKRSTLKATTDETLRALERMIEYAKTAISTVVEHPL